MKSLITPGEAMRLISKALPTFPSIRCPIDKCAGRVLRETITADRPFPPFNRSMMDGYAIRARDIDSEGIFRISIQVPAGSSANLIGAKPRLCAEIMTGGVVPDDADCVVPYEATKRLGEHSMQLLDPNDHRKGDCIHPYASDRPEGEVLLENGALIGSREIAVAATCGHSELTVTKIPSIAIVSTGDELVDVASHPEPHQIRRSNDIMIETALSLSQLNSRVRTHLDDDEALCTTELKKLIFENQVILLSGGVSMGKKDYIPNVLEELGLRNHFHGVSQKPGKPMGFWTTEDCAVFTLPGNPLSTLTCLHHYVIPAIHRASGQRQARAGRKVTIAEDIRARDDFTLFLPVSLGASNTATPQPTQNSGDLVRILNSDGYITVPPIQAKGYSKGASFEFYPWY